VQGPNSKIEFGPCCLLDLTLDTFVHLEDRTMSKSQKKLKWHPVICRAIRKKAVIQFDYHGTQRSVKPQSHGISSAKNEVIRGVQTNPRDPSGKQIEGKFYKVSEMTDLKETGESFSKPGPHFNPNDRGMIYVHCSLARQLWKVGANPMAQVRPKDKRVINILNRFPTAKSKRSIRTSGC
jgi:hypothetical protein